MYDTILRLVDGVSCTIGSAGFDRVTMYDINLRATHTTIPSTRGVEIHISLVSSTTDSVWQRVVVFKPVRIPTSDLKSEFLCQSSYIAQNLPDSPEPPCTPGIPPTPSSPRITLIAKDQAL